MHMLGTKSFWGLLAAIVATTCLGFASSGSHEAKRGANITFAENVVFNNGKTLPAGNYRMEVYGSSHQPEVAFYKRYAQTGDWGGRAAATTSARVVPEQQKNKTTEIDSTKSGSAQLVTQIRPAGWHEELRFGSSTHQSS